MKKLKQNKGITLIALIITIIVMLILVAVTVTVALNGGLFDKADEAKKSTLLRADEEELQIEIATAYDEKEGIINLETLAKNLRAKKWTVTDSGDKLICTSKNGNTFTVDKEGKITDGGEHIGGGNEPEAFNWGSKGLGNIDTSAEYKGYIEYFDMTIIASFTEDGRIIMYEGDFATDPIEVNVKGMEGTTLSFPIKIQGNTTNITVTMNGNNIKANIQGIGEVDYIKQEKTMYTNEEVLKKLGITNYTGTYEGTWVKIGTEDGKTKLLSTRKVADYNLGAGDPKATGADDLAKSIWSYQNAVKTLNEVAQKETGIPTARSINMADLKGLTTIEEVEPVEKTYNYENHANQIFVDKDGNIVKIMSEKDEVSLEANMYTGKITADEEGILSTIDRYTWIADTYVKNYDSYATFYVQTLGSMMYLGDAPSLLFQSNGFAPNNSVSAVRAVVSI